LGDNPHALSTGSGPPVLASGTLGPALERAAQRALACGALRPIETVQQTIEEGGIASSSARYQAPAQGAGPAGMSDLNGLSVSQVIECSRSDIGHALTKWATLWHYCYSRVAQML
jgi:hypothetical protein